jgi:Skp family chaperone for outer membrane proteins
MRTLRFALLAPFVAAALAPAAVAQDKSKTPASKSGVLVMNMDRAMQESDEGREVVAKLKEERATQQQRYADDMAKLQEKVKALREAKIQDRTPGYYDELVQAMQTYASLEMDKNVFMAKKGDELSRKMQQLLQGAQQEARAVMKARGAEIVLVTKIGPIEVGTEGDLQQELLLRRALCFDESIDITDEVIVRMNEWYAKNKNATGLPKREGGGAPEGGGAEKGKEKEKAGPAKEGAGKTGG